MKTINLYIKKPHSKRAMANHKYASP